MMRRRKTNGERIAGLITHPSHEPIKTGRILVKPLPKMPKIRDLAMERTKKRRI